MRKNKFINLVTSSTLFSFFYIMTFIVVISAALLTNGGEPWVKISWIMLSVLGVFTTLGAYVSYIEATQSNRWPAVSAKLLSAEVRSKVGSGSDQTYAPSVEYAFSFNGQDYKGNTVDYSAMSGSEAWAKKIIDVLKNKGAALTVRVNPEDPQMNVLNPGVRFVHLLRYIIGPAMIVFGLLAGLEIVDFK